MVVKIHQRIYSDEDPAVVDRAFELACSAFRQELDAYLAATPRKPRTKKSRRAKSITPTARRGGFKKTRNDISHDEEDDESNTFQLSANNSPNTKKRRRLLFTKSDVEIHEPHLVSPIKEMEFGYLPLLIDEESSEAENHGSDASNDQENVVPLGMEIATTTTDSDLKKDLPRIIKDEKIPTFSNSSEVVKLLSNEYGPYFKFSNGFGSLMEFKQPQVDLIYPNEQTNESYVTVYLVIQDLS
ncbi:hypothetical protein BDF19DRAFT_167249 [Syncephalis fuscata]|nr:hypothetical protein BDF19DRAFT_167249 [Syncephalis fuscata]